MPSSLTQLAEAVLKSAKILDAYFEEHNLPQPSFAPDGPADFGISNDAPHVEQARVEAVEAAQELSDLLQGPITFLRPIATGVSLQAISRWDLTSKVPVGGETTYAALASQCNIQEQDMKRLLRYAISHGRLFLEPRPGVVTHSLASRLLSENPLLKDGYWLMAEQYFTAAPNAVLALERWGSTPAEPNHTAFNIAFNTDKAAYEFMSATPEGRALGKRFAMAMTSFARFSSRPSAPGAGRLARLPEAYDWGKLGARKVVDVGGSRGADAIHLAMLYPELTFVVQDLPPMIEGAEVPPELKDRISFVPYSFFTAQTVAADVYIIKQCFHNWPDHYCVRILQNQVPALRSGARLIVIDSVVPPPGTMSLIDERNVRAFDIMMLTNSSGREREEEDWHKIFKAADERFRVNSIKSAHTKGDFGPASAIIEVVFE
ncbi:O-methyltransferase [Coniochaeta sp. 2T2.1]|nr:O-methyltransferase [Coniochaeta sp. 2T2.1]